MSVIRGVQLREATGSYATTGSNVFIGRQSVTGSISATAGISGSFNGSLTGSFRLTSTANANNQTISALGGLAFNNLGAVDIDGTATIYVKTTTTDVSGLRTRLTISGSGEVGIGTATPSSSLHVYKGLSGALPLGVTDSITLTLENSTTNYINFRTPNAAYAGLAFSTPADASTGYISLRQSTGEMFFSTENANGYHIFKTNDIERLRIANTETTVRNNLIVTGSAYITGSLYMNGNRQFNYGAFSHSGSQSLPGANQSASFQYNTTDVVGGVTYSNGSQLNIPSTGIYNIQFSAQLISTSQPDTKFYIWLKVNGSNVANTATAMLLAKNGAEQVAAWNWVYMLNASDYVEIAWQADHIGAQLYAVAASGNIPGIPSVIVTVTQVA
jgi:hypothetical protein